MKYDHRISTGVLVFFVVLVAIALPPAARASLLVPLAGVAIIALILLVLAWAGFGGEKKRRPWSSS